MKQTEMFRKAKPKARFCNWMTPYVTGWQKCGEPATVLIKDAAYCAGHAEKAQKLFGPATPITA